MLLGVCLIVCLFVCLLVRLSISLVVCLLDVCWSGSRGSRDLCMCRHYSVTIMTHWCDVFEIGVTMSSSCVLYIIVVQWSTHIVWLITHVCSFAFICLYIHQVRLIRRTTTYNRSVCVSCRASEARMYDAGPLKLARQCWYDLIAWFRLLQCVESIDVHDSLQHAESWWHMFYDCCDRIPAACPTPQPATESWQMMIDVLICTCDWPWNLSATY